MIENPKVDEEVEVQTSDDGPWRSGVIKQAPPETTFGAPWCQVQLDSGALCDFACGSEYIRRPLPVEKPKPKRQPPGPVVWVRVKAEIEYQLPSPWKGEMSHNELGPIAEREAHAYLQQHLPRGARLIDIHTVQTVVVSEKEKT